MCSRMVEAVLQASNPRIVIVATRNVSRLELRFVPRTPFAIDTLMIGNLAVKGDALNYGCATPESLAVGAPDGPDGGKYWCVRPRACQFACLLHQCRCNNRFLPVCLFFFPVRLRLVPS